jgi:8-oxo-dGTP pyrophosphatase MutT (NUDIX family)
VDAVPAPDREGAPNSVATLLARYPAESPPVSVAGAAVTIVLRDSPRGVESLLIERTVTPTDPASGQVAFPGGRVDYGDGSLLATALRELEEEVGLTRADLTDSPRFVGATSASRFRLTVGVFAAELGPAGHAPSPRSPAEVAHVFWLPRPSLDRTQQVHRETVYGLTPVNATVYEGHVLWGFTRRVLRDFFGLPAEDILAGPLFAGRRGSETSNPDGSTP